MRRGFGHLLLFVLLSNFISTAALSATSADIQNALNDEAQANELLYGLQSVVICTPQGLKRITLDENGNPVDNDEASMEHCVYCLPFHKVGIGVISQESDFPVVDLASYNRYAYDTLVIPSSRLDLSSPPRAPPFA